jgi:ribonuclease HII
MSKWRAIISDRSLSWSEGCKRKSGLGDFAGPLICGVDEAGRGPLAGPVVAAAVILPEDFNIQGLRDSKCMTARERESQKKRILGSNCVWGIGVIGPEIIDGINILQATLLAMREAVGAMGIMPNTALVDGNRRIPKLACSQNTIIGGDAIHPVISAASILAKTYRDAIMIKLDGAFPQYGFGRHKGYPTREHIGCLYRLGPCAIHRRSFHPVSLFFHE